MWRPNWRVVSVGAVLMVLALGFFIVMMGLAGRSNDPVALMRLAGELSGGVGGLAAAMVAFGLIGKQTDHAAR